MVNQFQTQTSNWTFDKVKDCEKDGTARQLRVKHNQLRQFRSEVYQNFNNYKRNHVNGLGGCAQQQQVALNLSGLLRLIVDKLDVAQVDKTHHTSRKSGKPSERQSPARA